jgi:nucleotide-binding universal stress UspA family protein
MYERILVPLDGSKVGEAALPHIEKLTDMFQPEVKIEIIILQVISDLTHYVVAGEASAAVPYNDKELELLKRKSLKYLQSIVTKMTGKNRNYKVEVAFGNAASEIINVAEKTNSDLIAMSTHGRSGITRWAFGSVTDRVLREGKKPVFMVRAPKGKD